MIGGGRFQWASAPADRDRAAGRDVGLEGNAGAVCGGLAPLDRRIAWAAARHHGAAKRCGKIADGGGRAGSDDRDARGGEDAVTAVARADGVRGLAAKMVGRVRQQAGEGDAGIVIGGARRDGERRGGFLPVGSGQSVLEGNRGGAGSCGDASGTHDCGPRGDFRYRKRAGDDRNGAHRTCGESHVGAIGFGGHTRLV